MKRKKVLALFLTVVLLFAFASVAFAALNVNPSANPDMIKTTAVGIAQKLTNVVQGVFAVIAVCFVIWTGVMFWGASGDPNKILTAKKALGGFIIAMVCVFFADKIVGGLLGIFGM